MDEPLVGRAAALAEVGDWLRDRLAGRPAPPVLLIGGEAGVGRTALVTAAVGSLDGAVPVVGSPGALADLPPGPAVVVLDDLQDADPDLLTALPGRVAAVAGAPVAVLGTVRTREVGPGVRRLRARLRHDGLLVERELAPLADADARELVGALGADLTAAEADVAAYWSQGVPGLTRDLLLDPAWVRRQAVVPPDPGPPPTPPEAVRDTVRLWTAALPGPARAALEAAAVLGEALAVADVVALTGRPWPDVLDDGGPLVGDLDVRRFRRRLVRAAVYADLGWSRRRDLHRAAAARLADRTARASWSETAAGHHAAVARHRVAAGDPAASDWLAAADAATAAHAHRAAVDHLTAALAEPATDRPGRRVLVTRLARAAELAGEPDRALAALDELLTWPKVASDGSDQSDQSDQSDGADGSDRAGLLARIAAQHELAGRWGPALAARTAAAAAYDRTDRPGRAAEERLAVAAHLRSAARLVPALEHLELAAAGARDARRVDLECRIAALRGDVRVRQGRVAEGLAEVRAALTTALGLAEGDATVMTGPAAEVYQRLGDALEHAGDYRGATRAYDAAYAFCARHDQAATADLCRACATVVLFLGGRWDAARTACRDVLGSPDATTHARAAAATIAGLVHALRGQPSAARPLLLEAQVGGASIELAPVDLLSAWGLALLDRQAGEPERARAGYAYLLQRAAAGDERHYCLLPLLDAVVTLGPAPERAAATALLAEAAARDAEPLARAAFAVARAESAAPADAVTHLRRAVDLLADQELPVADVLVRQRLAVALLDADPSCAEAAPLLAEAERTARRLRARVLLDGLAGVAARLPTPAVPAGPALSPREREVLELVGHGLTSRAIAQRLYLSVRTVEMHVGHAVTKLGCRTRAEAVARLVATR